jgi:hypothetical protein
MLLDIIEAHTFLFDCLSCVSDELCLLVRELGVSSQVLQFQRIKGVLERPVAFVDVVKMRQYRLCPAVMRSYGIRIGVFGLGRNSGQLHAKLKCLLVSTNLQIDLSSVFLVSPGNH